MYANLAALLYLVSGVLFILALRGLSSPETSRQGNRAGMIGMAIAIVTTLFYQPAVGPSRWVLIVARHCHRRRHRRLARAHNPDDGDAAARRLIPRAGRSGRGASSRPARCMRRKPSASARRATIHTPKPDRNVARRRHRRHHLHRFGDRLPEARRPHVRHADPAAAAPRDQYSARRFCLSCWSCSSSSARIRCSSG